MIDESMAAQRADIDTIKKKRGTDFKIKDAEPYVKVASKMEAIDNQAQSVFDLHVNSVKTHFDTLCSLTDTVIPEDDPFVEHYQTPPVLEILTEEDAGFSDSLDKFIDKIASCEALIGKEVIDVMEVFWLICVVDFALIPGSTSNVVNQILLETDIPENHKQAILAAKSWGMNTSYGVGEAFANALEGGSTAAEAVSEEIATLQNIYKNPIEAQGQLMDNAGHSSFDVKKIYEFL